MARQFLLLFTILFTLLALATALKLPDKSVIISYPKDTPDSILQAAKDAIKAAGGIITHEYSIIKGFAATAPAKVFETVKTMGDAKFPALVEEDQVVTIQG